MCSTARDLQACMTNLIWFREEDVLDAMLFKPLDDWQLVSPTPEEEVVLLSEVQEAPAAALHPPRCKEWAPKPKNMTKPMGAVAEPQGMLVCPPPLGLEPPLPKQDIPLIGITNPNGSQSVLMPVSAMNIFVYKTRWWATLSMSMRLIVSGHCIQTLARPMITKLWVMEWVFCSKLCSAKWRLKNEDHSVVLISLY